MVHLEHGISGTKRVYEVEEAQVGGLHNDGYKGQYRLLYETVACFKDARGS